VLYVIGNYTPHSTQRQQHTSATTRTHNNITTTIIS
jgi:hypothetical protein